MELFRNSKKGIFRVVSRGLIMLTKVDQRLIYTLYKTYFGYNFLLPQLTSTFSISDGWWHRSDFYIIDYYHFVCPLIFPKPAVQVL